MLNNSNETTEVSEPSEAIYDFDIRGSEDGMRVQLDLTRITEWSPSYNIAPTNTALIVTIEDAPKGFDYKYAIEPLKFGLVPSWLKPNDPTPVREGKETQGPKYSQEIGKNEAKYFNCRRESLDQSKSVWNSAKKFRCVIPIQGYFEWMKIENNKIPYFVHSATAPLCFLAGFYSHNYHYSENRNVKNEYLSTFTIITTPASKGDEYDLSWLHSRKPMLIQPGSQEWFEWLDPNKPWSNSLIGEVLNSTSNQAYADIEAYKVTKDVGNPSNNGVDMISKIDSKKQKPIGLFFLKNQKKRKSIPNDDDSFDSNEELKLKQEQDETLKQENSKSTKSTEKTNKPEPDSPALKKLKADSKLKIEK